MAKPVKYVAMFDFSQIMRVKKALKSLNAANEEMDKALSDLPAAVEMRAESTIQTIDSLKTVREALSAAQTAVQHTDSSLAATHARVLQRLIDNIDRQRPLGPDGKHGDRHTKACGCDREEW